jgi:hypothetical protein
MSVLFTFILQGFYVHSHNHQIHVRTTNFEHVDIVINSLKQTLMESSAHK